MKRRNELPVADDLISGGPIRDLECEQSVLASMMSSYSNAAESLPVLDRNCFYLPKHQDLFQAIQSVFETGDSPNMISVGAELGKMGSKMTRMELTSLVLNSPIALDCYKYSLRLKDLSYRRKMWETGLIMMSSSRIESYETEQIQNEAKTTIDSLFEDMDSNDSSLTESYRELQEQMLLNHDREPGTIIGTPTGFPEWDRRGGLMGSDLIVIGAHSSQGKTSLATALTLSALRNQEAVAFYSMEMTPKQLAARIASMLSGESSRRISNERLDIQDIYRIDEAMAGIDMSRLRFDGRSTASLDSIISSIRQMKAKHGISGAVVDYLQLVSVKEEKLNREQSVAKAARDLKNLAKELGIWIIALSQLNRGNESGMPTMAQLRDSGQIEEAADVVVLIHRPDPNGRYPAPYSNVDPRGTALLKIEKGRNIGVFEMIAGFKPENTLFYPLYQNMLPCISNSECSQNAESSAPGHTSDNHLPF